MSVVLEPMAGRHVDAVCAIDSRCYSRPWSASQWRTELAADDRTHLVARDNDHVVAHAGTLRVLDELHITTVAVDPDHEGKGHGTRLCIELLRLGIAAGATAATLEVRLPAFAAATTTGPPTTPSSCGSTISTRRRSASGSIGSLLNSTRSPMEPPHDRRPHSRHRDQL